MSSYKTVDITEATANEFSHRYYGTYTKETIAADWCPFVTGWKMGSYDVNEGSNLPLGVHVFFNNNRWKLYLARHWTNGGTQACYVDILWMPNSLIGMRASLMDQHSYHQSV